MPRWTMQPMTFSESSRPAFGPFGGHGRRRRPPAMNASLAPAPSSRLLLFGFRSFPSRAPAFNRRSKGRALASIPPAATIAHRQPAIRASGSAQRCFSNRWSRQYPTRVRQWIRSVVESFVNLASLGGSCRESRAVTRLISALFPRKPFAASRRTRSSSSSAALRVAGASLGAFASRKSNAQTAHRCWGTSPRRIKGARPRPQAGQRSSRPHRCRRHVMTLARRQLRRK